MGRCFVVCFALLGVFVVEVLWFCVCVVFLFVLFISIMKKKSEITLKHLIISHNAMKHILLFLSTLSNDEISQQLISETISNKYGGRKHDFYGIKENPG